MTITSSSNSVTIKGNIKSIGDFQDIKNHIDGMVGQHMSIVLNIVDSISITSSVIGYFNKLVQKDGISIQMLIGDEQLMSLVDDLNLKTVFKARKV